MRPVETPSHLAPLNFQVQPLLSRYPPTTGGSNLIKKDHGGQAFNYPLSFRSVTDGLVVNYTIPLSAFATEYRQPMGGYKGIVVGLGMPFVYFTKNSADIARITVEFNPQGATVSGNKIIIQGNMNNSNFVVFGPAGSSWSGGNGTFSPNLGGKTYGPWPWFLRA